MVLPPIRLPFGFAAMKAAFGAKWARVIYAVFIALVFALLIVLITYVVVQMKRAPVTLIGNVSVTRGEVRPTTTEISANTPLAAQVDVTDLEWEKQSDGSYFVSATIHISSKFVRSGLLLHFVTKGMDLAGLPMLTSDLEHPEPSLAMVQKPFTLVPLNRQPTVAGPYYEKNKTYSHYIQRPWGLYRITLRLTRKEPIDFSYRFEGEQEVSLGTWQIP